jgi:hypothetical protein
VGFLFLFLVAQLQQLSEDIQKAGYTPGGEEGSCIPEEDD